MVQDTEGQPSAIPADEFVVGVVSPDDRRCLNPVVWPGTVKGMFLFQIPDAFLTEDGDYTVSMSAPKHRVLPVVRKLHVVR